MIFSKGPSLFAEHSGSARFGSTPGLFGRSYTLNACAGMTRLQHEAANIVRKQLCACGSISWPSELPFSRGARLFPMVTVVARRPRCLCYITTAKESYDEELLCLAIDVVLRTVMEV